MIFFVLLLPQQKNVSMKKENKMYRFDPAGIVIPALLLLVVLFLPSCHRKDKVALYGLSKIRSFDTIEVENLHSLSFRMSATYNVDYNQPAVQRFLLKYRALYNTEPTAFAFQGYDLMKYMLILKSGSAQDGTNPAINKRIDLLQESFLLSKQGQGWVNTATREVVYGSGYNIESYQSSSYILNQ